MPTPEPFQFDPDHPTPILDAVAGELASILAACQRPVRLGFLAQATGRPNGTVWNVLNSPRPRHARLFTRYGRGRRSTYALAGRFPDPDPPRPRAAEDPDTLRTVRDILSSHPDGIGLRDIAMAAGLSRSTAHETLQEIGATWRRTGHRVVLWTLPSPPR